MAKRLGQFEVNGLQLRTLSGTYEASRAMLRLIDISTIATYEQLKKRLLAITKDGEKLKEMFAALDALSKYSDKLGRTTLIQPTPHPLITRVPPFEKKETV